MKPPGKDERNAEIARRVSLGERVADLAREYGVSRARLHQIAKMELARLQHKATPRTPEDFDYDFLGGKTHGVLWQAGIRTAQDAAAFSEAELREIRNVGDASVECISAWLKHYGLMLRDA